MKGSPQQAQLQLDAVNRIVYMSHLWHFALIQCGQAANYLVFEHLYMTSHALVMKVIVIRVAWSRRIDPTPQHAQLSKHILGAGFGDQSCTPRGISGGEVNIQANTIT